MYRRRHMQEAACIQEERPVEAGTWCTRLRADARSFTGNRKKARPR